MKEGPDHSRTASCHHVNGELEACSPRCCPKCCHSCCRCFSVGNTGTASTTTRKYSPIQRMSKQQLVPPQLCHRRYWSSRCLPLSKSSRYVRQSIWNLCPHPVNSNLLRPPAPLPFPPWGGGRGRWWAHSQQSSHSPRSRSPPPHGRVPRSQHGASLTADQSAHTAHSGSGWRRRRPAPVSSQADRPAGARGVFQSFPLKPPRLPSPPCSSAPCRGGSNVGFGLAGVGQRGGRERGERRRCRCGAVRHGGHCECSAAGETLA